ncbi:urate hydroxylase PuuD [Aestuariispira insulae]|uniref:Putative membrane protein n=1 Tax=Aestuariispira insulae TaxID=1461337 RepID=A0A3D9HWF5_9PROT|nr:urate hydroxylase PuuD [Aestuariispira insulae]RED53832.1 putative membrane protein [Aestuariispira insulae]
MFDVNVAEWLNLLLRWVHIITGIAWIGSSFYFVFTDASLRPNKALNKKAHGETWQVHGGGFYHIQKYLVAPDKMPTELHWFKFEAYFTWLSGFLLLSVIYYLGADAFLIDSSKLDITASQGIMISIAMLAGGWILYDLLCRSPLGDNLGLLALLVFLLVVGAGFAFTQVFAGRAAYVHAGALIGSMMVGNVFFVIIPNQKKVVKALTAGEEPAAILGKQAKQRSMHNNYLTLPVLLMMISNHYPMTYGHDYSWLIFAMILVIGGLVRHYYNSKNAGIEAGWMKFLYPTAGALMLALILFVSFKPGGNETLAEGADAVTAKQAFAVVQQRCVACHSSLPTHEDFDEAPGGVTFDTIDDVLAHLDAIKQQAVDTDAMPLGNMTEMTEEERQLLGQWISLGAKVASP